MPLTPTNVVDTGHLKVLQGADTFFSGGGSGPTLDSSYLDDIMIVETGIEYISFLLVETDGPAAAVIETLLGEQPDRLVIEQDGETNRYTVNAAAWNAIADAIIPD